MTRFTLGALVVVAAGAALLAGGVATAAQAQTPFPNPMRDTFTTLTASPASPADVGTAVAVLVARVAPGAAAGAVQFRDGNTALEALVPVVDGFAVVITRQLTTVGTHPLTAMFIPASPAAFTPSTSNTVPVEVQGGGDNGDG